MDETEHVACIIGIKENINMLEWAKNELARIEHDEEKETDNGG